MSNTSNNRFEKYYVVDTNIILQDAHAFITLSDNSENLVIIPETVLDEIDAKKSGFDEINYQAREFGRLLSDAEVISMDDVSREYKIISIRLTTGFNVRVDIISKETYKTDTIKNVSPNIVNDKKILEITTFAQEHYLHEDERKTNKLTFLSLDIMARTRAISLSVATDTLKGDGENVFDYEFHKTIVLDKVIGIADVNEKTVLDFDPEYKCHNFSYSIGMPDGREILCAVHDEKLFVLDEDEIRCQSVSPKNKEQLFFSNAILDDRYDIVVVDAPAGGGKTLAGLSSCMKMVREKRFSKIVYIRNSIESLDKNEEIGFLSGNDEKFKIYNHPLMDSIEYIVRSEMKKSVHNKAGGKESHINTKSVQEKVEETIDRYGIETLWVGALRGRTISNAVIMIDEAQNMSNKTMQLVLTRIDKSCKVVILGSTKQIDNSYINKHTNGLTTVIRSTSYSYDEIKLFSIELTKVLRGPITEWAENIFSPKKK
jgi:PhoH-like ATPase